MFEELEAQRGEHARRVATGITQAYGDRLGNTSGIYLGADVSLGASFDYDDNGDVIEPDGGYWSLSDPIGSKPLKP